MHLIGDEQQSNNVNFEDKLVEKVHSLEKPIQVLEAKQTPPHTVGLDLQRVLDAYIPDYNPQTIVGYYICTKPKLGQ